MQQWQPNLCKREKLDKWGTVIWLQYCPTAIRSWPALQVAEVQQVKLPVVLRVIDGVHILGETLSMSAWHPPHIVHSHIYVTFKHTHSNTGTAPQLLPTALPPCSWCHYSRTEQRKSLRSLLRKERGRNKQKRGKKSWWEQLLPSAVNGKKGRKIHTETFVQIINLLYVWQH